jgi:type IV pilus biogenesis protein PilP
VEDSAPEATPQAVAASLKPQPRPENFQRIVRQAPQQSAAAATVAPRIPSSASVARSATDRNAINMRQVNLIGVYGSPSNRRALVRLSNGRYQKVQVGDRMDGGRVSAIGDSELRYNKRGRDVVLRMPKG